MSQRSPKAQRVTAPVTPHKVRFAGGVADSFIRKIHVGREHVQEVPQWYGETVGL